jgi:hypothetical protein
MPSCSHVDPASVLTALADIVHQGSTPKEMVCSDLCGCNVDGSRLRPCQPDVAYKIDKLEQALGTGHASMPSRSKPPT